LVGYLVVSASEGIGYGECSIMRWIVYLRLLLLLTGGLEIWTSRSPDRVVWISEFLSFSDLSPRDCRV